MNPTEQFIKDAAAFIHFNELHKVWSDTELLNILTHDILGLADNIPVFVPKVSGYHNLTPPTTELRD
jgi:hypothetical protein